MRQLVSELTSHAEEALYSPNDWATHLTMSAASRSFLAALREEWLPAEPPDSFCRAMSDHVQTHLASVYAGWHHLWAHTLRVTGIALALAEESDIDPAHAYLMGIFHDAGKLDEMITGAAHERVGAPLIRKALREEYHPTVIERMANVIAKLAPPTDSYMHILYDADKLDKIGAAGILRRLTTRWGASRPTAALRTVSEEMEDFPAMHFARSALLTGSKITYTAEFLQTAQTIRF